MVDTSVSGHVVLPARSLSYERLSGWRVINGNSVLTTWYSNAESSDVLYVIYNNIVSQALFADVTSRLTVKKMDRI